MMPPYTSVKVRWTTTPGTTFPTLYEECVGSLTSQRFITSIVIDQKGFSFTCHYQHNVIEPLVMRPTS